MKQKLKNEIMNLSINEDWQAAKREWKFKYAYKHHYKRCLCGHYPIAEICIIKNNANGNVAEVGNCCVENFLNLNFGTKIFYAINSITKDVNKSIGLSGIEYLKSIEAISDYEYGFYRSTVRKTSLSNKQRILRKNINHRFLLVTTEESVLVLEKIKRLLEWANNSQYSNPFVKSLKSYFCRFGYLTSKQIEVMDKILVENAIK